MTKMQFG